MNPDLPKVSWLDAPFRADEELAPMDARVSQHVLHNVPARVAVVARDNTYLFSNREMLDFLGKQADEVVGRHVAEVLGHERFAVYEQLAERVWAGEVLHWEGWVDYAGLGRRYVQETVVPCVTPDRTVNAAAAFSRDLTDLKLREQDLATREAQLAASEALKSAIVDHALAALISTDAAGLIVEFNPAAETMFGHARSAVLGRSVSETIIPQRLRPMHEAGMKRLAEGGQPRILGKRVQMKASRADGSEFPVEMVLWRTDVAGSVFYTASMFDQTERLQAQEQIERQRDALRQSEKLSAMGSLLAGVAHELNNPLSIVIGRATFLEERCSDAGMRLDAKRIREAAQRCGRIVRTFLNMARSRPFERRPVVLNDVVMAAVEMLNYSFSSHGITVDLALDPALQPVLADPDQIAQIVLNLLVNAQQALVQENGLRQVLVATGIDPERDDVEAQAWLRIADSGPGVPAELAGRIFEPFFTTKPEGLGTGIGLAVSRSLARAHGGELVLEPPGTDRGASFRVSLPTGGWSEAAPAPGVLPGTVAAGSLRILVVDDELEVAALARDVLEGAGHEVATAESGEVALAMLAAASFDAVVSDLHMPDMSGMALWRRIEQAHPSLARRFLFITGDTLSPDASRFLKTSGCPGLDKPFANQDLLAAVAALVR